MALIRCPECSSEVSDQAHACPQCGFPVASRINRSSVAAGLPSSTLNEVRTALLSGNKIAAIKAYREATNLGLTEAKQAVEQIEQEIGLSNGATQPPQAVRSSTGGFFVMLLIIVLILAGIAVWLFNH